MVIQKDMFYGKIGEGKVGYRQSFARGLLINLYPFLLCV